MAALPTCLLILALIQGSVQLNCNNCSSQTIPTASHVRKLMSALFLKSYDKNVIPMLWNNETLYVDLQFSLIQLPEFDEVAGTLLLIMKMKVRWLDEYIVLNYLPKTHLLMEIDLQSDDIWLPPVTVFNSVSSLTPLIKGGYDATLTLTNGQVDLNIGIVTKTGCTVDTTDFPFDEQTCEIMFTPWGYQSHEVEFLPTTTYARTDQFVENQEWELLSSSINTTSLSNRSILSLSITVKRRPIYFMINMIIPVVLLGVLNSLSFVLPPTAGERMGFATNIFLTFAVYLTILSQNLPETSKPMSNMVYYLVIMLSVSSLTTFVTILSLRIYAKEEDNTPVPWILVYIFGLLTCRLCRKSMFMPPKRKKRSESKQTLTKEMMMNDTTEVKRDLSDGASVVDDDESMVQTMEYVDEVSDDDEEEEECRYGITWTVVGKTVDKTLFLIFMSGTLIISGYYILPLLLGTTGVTTE
ncbi:unnamed protein product [Mytilus coruscus]|uniref:CHRNN n=1 Tax=Mytilus coruscus TaxID=42192 RepID=A0A6J8E9C6_MYTCO|nr:unnamed protein product [Mytilus coruscus]